MKYDKIRHGIQDGTGTNTSTESMQKQLQVGLVLRLEATENRMIIEQQLTEI